MQSKLDGFFEWLNKRNLAAPMCRLTTRTKPKLIPAASQVFPKGIEHLCSQAIQIGVSYENCVKNATQDFDFQVQQLWAGKGRHTSNNRYLVEHVEKPGQYYLAYRVLPNNNLKEKWIDLAKRRIIPKPVEFLYKKSPPKHPIIWRTVMLQNVERIICGNFVDELKKVKYHA